MSGWSKYDSAPPISNCSPMIIDDNGATDLFGRRSSLLNQTDDVSCQLLHGRVVENFDGRQGVSPHRIVH